MNIKRLVGRAIYFTECHRLTPTRTMYVAQPRLWARLLLGLRREPMPTEHPPVPVGRKPVLVLVGEWPAGREIFPAPETSH